MALNMLQLRSVIPKLGSLLRLYVAIQFDIEGVFQGVERIRPC
jgi:hypothetical protein